MVKSCGRLRGPQDAKGWEPMTSTNNSHPHGVCLTKQQATLCLSCCVQASSQKSQNAGFLGKGKAFKKKATLFLS